MEICDVTDIRGMTNEFPKPGNDGTPNYYGGGVPSTPAPQPQADPYANPYGIPSQQQPAPFGAPPQQPAPFGTPPQFAQPQQSPYAQPYQQMPPYSAVPQSSTNKNALISLITSLVTLFILCGIPVIGTATAIAGIVFGHKALKETKDVPNSGNGIALAGTITGYLALVASIIVSVMVVLIFVAAAMSDTSTY